MKYQKVDGDDVFKSGDITLFQKRRRDSDLEMLCLTCKEFDVTLYSHNNKIHFDKSGLRMGRRLERALNIYDGSEICHRKVGK